MLIDLQLHSKYSDGYLTPTELVDFISGQGVKVAALTDHNTVRGIGEFRQACKEKGIKPINGIEIYSRLNHKRLNIVWYNFDHNDPKLHDLLRRSQRSRRKKARRILKNLKEAGFQFETSEILDKYTHYIPVNHLADEILENPTNVDKLKERLKTDDLTNVDLIGELFQNSETGKLRESYIGIEQILELKKEIGGQVILCHPAKHHYYKKEIWDKLKNLGLDGIEKLSPHHSYNAIMYLQRIAREYDFIESGGSDFHLTEGNNHLIQYSWQYYTIDTKYLRKINKIIEV